MINERQFNELIKQINENFKEMEERIKKLEEAKPAPRKKTLDKS